MFKLMCRAILAHLNKSYTLLKTDFKTESKKTIKKAIIVGAKTSNHPTPFVITLITKRIPLNDIPI